MITCFYSVYDNVVLVFTVQVNQQIETNHSMQDKLHGDLEHKDMALEIDRDCHEMHNDAIDIKVNTVSVISPSLSMALTTL
jgi:hypothetical protein